MVFTIKGVFQTSKHLCCVDSVFVVCIQQQMQGSVCLLYVMQLIRDPVCLTRNSLTEQSQPFFGTYKLGMSAKIPEIGYLFPVVC